MTGPHASLCYICPYNGQTKVGTDGPLDAPYIAVLEAPGEDEEKHERPMVGRSGYMFKAFHLSKMSQVEGAPPAVELYQKPGNKWPIVKRLNTFIINLIMCRPKGNDITSADAKRAIKCCAPSFKAVMRRLLEEEPHRLVISCGAAATSGVINKKVAIDKQRGRVNVWQESWYEVDDTDAIEKDVLKGQKIERKRHGISAEEWKAFEKGVLRPLGVGWRKVRKALVKWDADMKDGTKKKVKLGKALNDQPTLARIMNSVEGICK